MGNAFTQHDTTPIMSGMKFWDRWRMYFVIGASLSQNLKTNKTKNYERIQIYDKR